MATCTGCSLLCEDIELVLKTGAISQGKNLCRRAMRISNLFSLKGQLPLVDGQQVSIDEAIKKAAGI